MNKILFVANVEKEHILKFHIPTIETFKKNGWIVDVACSGNGDVPNCDSFFNMPWGRTPFKGNLVKGIKQLKHIICQNDYDVVYCHTFIGGIAARLAVKGMHNRPFMVFFSHGFHFFKGNGLVKNILLKHVEKRLSKWTDFYFTINDEDSSVVNNCFRKEYCQLPGIGINFDRLNIENRAALREQYRKEFNVDDKRVLIYVAEITKNKNQEFLLKVLKYLDKDYALVLVGPNHYEKKFYKLIKKYDVQNNVILTGWRSDIGELLNMSDICVASSIREGFGINLVEAAYFGLPIVAVNNRGHFAVSKLINGCMLVKTPFEMAQCINKLREKSDTRFLAVDFNSFDTYAIAKKIFCEIEEKLL